MTSEEVLDRWQARLAEWTRLHVHVDGELVAREIISDLRGLAQDHDNGALSLTAAAAESGYSRRQLSRMIAEGQITNVGRPHAPRLLRKDLPKKLSPSTDTATPRDPSLLSIARNVTSAKSSRRGQRNDSAA